MSHMILKSEMATNDEDFIDIEVTTTSSSSSPPQKREFEFQMSSVSTTSPADDLFYKGKLLPLHLPPRLQMVQKLVHTCEQDCRFPTNACFTPVDSCNISLAESCRVSCELNPSEYFFNWSTSDESRSFIHNHHPKKSWSNKLKLMKQSSFLTQKLKTSRLYLKSLFIKSGCSIDSTRSKNREIAEQQVAGKKCDDNIIQSRRSFSGVIKRHSPTKCLSSSSSSESSSSSSGTCSLSSSFSGNSNVVFDLHLFKRSSGDPSEIETSIQAAIAHCKNSQRPFSH